MDEGCENVWTEGCDLPHSYLQYAHDCLGLRLSVRVADVDHMEQDLRVLDLLEGRPGGWTEERDMSGIQREATADVWY